MTVVEDVYNVQVCAKFLSKSLDPLGSIANNHYLLGVFQPVLERHSVEMFFERVRIARIADELTLRNPVSFSSSLCLAVNDVEIAEHGSKLVFSPRRAVGRMAGVEHSPVHLNVQNAFSAIDWQ